MRCEDRSFLGVSLLQQVDRRLHHEKVLPYSLFERTLPSGFDRESRTVSFGDEVDEVQPLASLLSIQPKDAGLEFFEERALAARHGAFRSYGFR